MQLISILYYFCFFDITINILQHGKRLIRKNSKQ
jgi:hypothetical protein